MVSIELVERYITRTFPRYLPRANLLTYLLLTHLLTHSLLTCSPAMALESEAVDVTRSFSSAPSARSTLVTPTVITSCVPVRLAAIERGSEPTVATPREARIAVARADKSSGEKGSESCLPATTTTGAVRARVIVRLMLLMVDVDAAMRPTTTVQALLLPLQTASVTELSTPS